MRHPKTTILGVLTVLSGLLNALVAALSGGGLDSADVSAVTTAVGAGVGLIAAGDARAERKEIRR